MDFLAKQPPREPTADQRQGAAEMRGMFLAMVAEGFTEQQALYVIGTMLGGAAAGRTANGGSVGD